MVEINPEAVRGVQRDVSATRDALQSGLGPLRRAAADLGVALGGFDEALGVADRLGTAVLPVVREHARRAEDLAALRWSGDFGATIPVVDVEAPGAGGAGTAPHLSATAGGTRVSWAATSAQEEAADAHEAAAARSVSDWFGDRWSDLTAAVDEGADRIASTLSSAWSATRDGVAEAVGAIGDRWRESTAAAGAWVDGNLDGVRDWIGEHVGAFRWLAQALRVAGWVVVVVGVVLTVAGAVVGALGGDEGEAGDLLDTLADWGEGTIDGQELVQRGALELGTAASTWLGVGAVVKGGQALLQHLPPSWVARAGEWLRELTGRRTDPTRSGAGAGSGWVRGGEVRLTEREEAYGLDVGDGGRAEQADSLVKDVSPSVAALGGDPARRWGVDPVSGDPLTQAEWAARYLREDGSIRWPPDGGAVARSRVFYDDPAAFTKAYGDAFDRIGGEGGGFLGVPPGTPYAQRSLAPYSLGADAHAYTFTGKLPEDVRIEVSRIAPAFGQPGGGVQARFVDPHGEEYSVEWLKGKGVLR
nr:TNT domain-containing protein [Kineococcus vitellinus]